MSYDSKPETAGDRLRRSRLYAGFRSPQAAASENGWSLNTYKSHEAGRRSLTAEAGRRYAAAFGVSLDWLMLGKGDPPPMSGGSVEEDLSDDRRRGALRLAAARMVAGFTTQVSASRYFGFNKKTYTFHESGAAKLSKDWCSIYGLAFGVSPEWLCSGSGEGGLPSEILQAVEKGHAQDVEQLRRAKAGFDYCGRGDPDTVQALMRRLHPPRSREFAGTPTSRQVQVAQLEMNRGRSTLGGVWGLPTKFVQKITSAPAGLRVVEASDTVQGFGLSPGDYLIVETQPSANASGVFLYEEWDGWRATEDPTPHQLAKLVGRIVAKISKIHAG